MEKIEARYTIKDMSTNHFHMDDIYCLSHRLEKDCSRCESNTLGIVFDLYKYICYNCFTNEEKQEYEKILMLYYLDK